jgi:GNAT superfamily N-acetyltransferase
MVIRALGIDDLEQMRSLTVESEAEGFHFLARMIADLDAGSLSLDTPRQFFLGVFDRDELLALGGVTPDPYTDRSDTGRVRHVFVKQAARRRGIGRELLRALEARACEQFDILRLRTDTMAAALFYERLGFEPTSQANATHSKECNTCHLK